jgi:hypothetical protein
LLVTGSEKVSGEWMQRPLIEDGILTAQRKGHPRDTGPLGLDTFCALDHLLVSAEVAGFSGHVDEALAAFAAISIHTCALAPMILASSDCIWPRRFLMRFSHDLDLARPLLDLAPARLVALWHPRNQGDSGHARLRECLYQAAAAARARRGPRRYAKAFKRRSRDVANGPPPYLTAPGLMGWAIIFGATCQPLQIPYRSGAGNLPEHLEAQRWPPPSSVDVSIRQSFATASSPGS